MKAICFLLTAFTLAAAAPSRPNILFILADDLGYGDLASYGSKVAKTPRLDQLASEGTRFTQFYVSHCVCSPTRASAITGHFPGRHRIYGHIAFFTYNQRRGMPDWLDVKAPSLPRALQAAGYRTAMFGKWHLGGGSGRQFQAKDLKTPDRLPSLEGRKIVINHPDAPAVTRYGFDHARTSYGNSPTWRHAEPWPEPHEIYPYADPEWNSWSSRAIADETIAFLREQKSDQPFYANVWLKDVHVPLRPPEGTREPFGRLAFKPRDHYASIYYMDQQIGRILDALKDLKLADNTIVLFSSDNGAGRGRGGSNGSLRGWKHELYEGGIRVPLIVRWPGRVPVGRVDESSILNIVDFTPTFTRLAGAKMPDGYKPDGEDIRSALLGKGFKRSMPQYWHYPSTRKALALRSGNWKLLTDLKGGAPELYDLASDPSETTNLAADQPHLTGTLQDSLRRWYAELPIAASSKD